MARIAMPIGGQNDPSLQKSQQIRHRSRPRTHSRGLRFYRAMDSYVKPHRQGNRVGVFFVQNSRGLRQSGVGLRRARALRKRGRDSHGSHRHSYHGRGRRQIHLRNSAFRLHRDGQHDSHRLPQRNVHHQRPYGRTLRQGFQYSQTHSFRASTSIRHCKKIPAIPQTNRQGKPTRSDRTRKGDEKRRAYRNAFA